MLGKSHPCVPQHLPKAWTVHDLCLSQKDSGAPGETVSRTHRTHRVSSPHVQPRGAPCPGSRPRGGPGARAAVGMSFSRGQLASLQTVPCTHPFNVCVAGLMLLSSYSRTCPGKAGGLTLREGSGPSPCLKHQVSCGGPKSKGKPTAYSLQRSWLIHGPVMKKPSRSSREACPSAEPMPDEWKRQTPLPCGLPFWTDRLAARAPARAPWMCLRSAPGAHPCSLLWQRGTVGIGGWGQEERLALWSELPAFLDPGPQFTKHIGNTRFFSP